MKRLWRGIFLVLILASIFGGGVRASGMRFEDVARVLPASLRVNAGYGHGCGWDYPCAPRPGYREPDCPGRWCGAPYGGEPARRVYEEDHGPCADGPCHTGCGTWCWLHRFREGYCGHGCGFYRERVDFVTDYRLIEVPRSVYYRLPYPCHTSGNCRDVPHPAYYRPPYPCYAPGKCRDLPPPVYYRPPYRCHTPGNCRDVPRRTYYRPPYLEPAPHPHHELGAPHELRVPERVERYPEHTGRTPPSPPEPHFVPRRRFEGPVYPAQ